MRRNRNILLAGLLLLAALLPVSACIGSYPLSLSRIFAILQGRETDAMAVNVFWRLRLPRVLMGACAGAALGLAGSVYQTIFRNPLASPDLTGVASGASFGAACAIVFGAGTAMEIMAGAFGMGLFSLVLVLLLVGTSRLQQGGSYILAGVIITSLADAGLMALKYMADPERELAAIEFWTMGSLGGMTADKLFPQLLLLLVPMALLLSFHRQAVMLSLGSEYARSLGLDPVRWRCLLLGCSTLMIAAVVSVTGVIAFVGLIAPHIAFLILKRRNGAYFLLSAFIGADLLLLSDIFARSLSKGAELPLSILTVFFAVPMLILLLYRKGGSRETDF